MNHIDEEQQNTVPLNLEAHRLALEFAKEQHNAQKGKKVYYNTLAIYAVHSFLKWLRIESDLAQGESWNPGLRALFDVADLVLPGLGKLECRRILPGENDCVLPIEVTDDRIGYVGVKFEDKLNEVHIVGFIPEINSLEPPERLRLVDFQPIEVLIDKIYLLESKKIGVQAFLPRKEQTLVDLRQWFEDIFEVGWHTVETLFGTSAVSQSVGVRETGFLREKLSYDPAFSVTRAKQVDLGIRLSGHPLALIVTIAPQTDGQTYIRLRLRPSGGQICLPPGVRLTVFDESGTTSPDLGAQARDADDWIQLQFRGDPGEEFRVEVTFEDASITEYFMI